MEWMSLSGLVKINRYRWDWYKGHVNKSKK